VHARHLLRRGNCIAYVAGDPAHYAGAIVQAEDWPDEPIGYGRDPHILWDLLRSVEGWTCIAVDLECASRLGEIIEREMGVRVRYLDDVHHTLSGPVRAYRDPAVRRLTLADLDLLASAPRAFRASLWGDARALLTEGIAAGAVVGGRIVATASLSAATERYGDVGVYTDEAYRGRGLATAAASIVAGCVQEAGRTPVWSAGAHNAASLRVAAKLGFVEISRRRYVIV
jgi:RimJ/RimL family protein N-acetyltransferase